MKNNYLWALVLGAVVSTDVLSADLPSVQPNLAVVPFEQPEDLHFVQPNFNIVAFEQSVRDVNDNITRELAIIKGNLADTSLSDYDLDTRYQASKPYIHTQILRVCNVINPVIKDGMEPYGFTTYDGIAIAQLRITQTLQEAASKPDVSADLRSPICMVKHLEIAMPTEPEK